jgi:hypothetical protein
MAYHLQGLSMAIGLFIATICFAFITPQIQRVFSPNQRCVCTSPQKRKNYPPTNIEPTQQEMGDSV